MKKTSVELRPHLIGLRRSSSLAAIALALLPAAPLLAQAS
ncbi:MAG: hypothetical protein JWM38_2071, partial [Sphingomonas bacterium]|nr:hypothetical protein [Sphingomonas bacterium]